MGLEALDRAGDGNLAGVALDGLDFLKEGGVLGMDRAGVEPLLIGTGISRKHLVFGVYDV